MLTFLTQRILTAKKEDFEITKTIKQIKRKKELLIVLNYFAAFIHVLYTKGIILKHSNGISSLKVSDRLSMLSGVQKGSVLGPCLFLAYFNGLPGSVRSRLRLFADDTIVYLTIKSQASAQSLKNDFHNLEIWEK